MSVVAGIERPSLLSELRADLAPFPGRLAMTWRIALLCAIVSATAMMFMTVEAAISCYLIIFLMKPDPVINIGTGLGLIVMATIIVLVMVFIIRLTIGSPLQQMLAMAVFSFLFLYIGAASQLGEMGGIVGLVIAFILTLVGLAPTGDLVTFGLRSAWSMAAMPMALMVVFNLFLGMSSVRLIRQTVLTRLDVAAGASGAGAPGDLARLREQLAADNGAVEQQAMFVRLLALAGPASAAQIAADVRASYRLMLAVSILPGDLAQERRQALSSAAMAAAAALRAGRAPSPVTVPEEAGAAERDAYAGLSILAGAPAGEVIAAKPTPFFFPDALTNPIYQRFALKTTAAAMTCYIIYTGLDWQGIQTALVTCYVAALGSSGETVHKLMLRICGCLVGAAMGIGSILFVIPHLDSVGGLMALVFVGVFAGAWVSTGPERISYGGVQIALAFLLTVLQGYAPPTSLDTAWDRIVGILLGNLVVYLIFTRVWPVPVAATARQHLGAAFDGLTRLAALEPERRGHAVSEAARVEMEAGKAEEALDLVRFEPSVVATPPQTERTLREARDEVGVLLRDIYLGRLEEKAIGERLESLKNKVTA